MNWDLLKHALVHDLQLQHDALVPTASLADVGLDSLAAVELAESLQSRYGVRVADYEILDSADLAGLAELITARSTG
ncbi:acyl carrier protein [Actinoplanes sp. NPDC051851]|uniref:acyl carrier protein n=1 Tax=Actinoplanes sp. NPDC051851 TaxID=3154753 RepID=UPI00342E8B3C